MELYTREVCKECGGRFKHYYKCGHCDGNGAFYVPIKSADIGTKKLLEFTRLLDKHPEEWDGPCECQLCLSYG